MTTSEMNMEKLEKTRKYDHVVTHIVFWSNYFNLVTYSLDFSLL
jgi:hypothetical protein